MVKNIAAAYAEEQAYIVDKLAGNQSNLLERLGRCGFTSLADYEAAKKDYGITVARAEVMRVDTPDMDIVNAIMYGKSLAGKSVLVLQELTGKIAMVCLKGEIYEDKAAEEGVAVLRTACLGGTLIEGENDVHFIYMLPQGYVFNYDLGYFNNRVLKLLKKYEPTVYIDGNDFMLEGKKVGGAAFVNMTGTQVYAVGISGEDYTDLVEKIIPPRSIKKVGWLNMSSYRENLIEDIITAFGGVR